MYLFLFKLLRRRTDNNCNTHSNLSGYTDMYIGEYGVWT